ncbi:MAG: DMT family transporter [Litoreibacter sp.]
MCITQVAAFSDFEDEDSWASVTDNNCYWGASFLFIKVALESITPITIAAGRIALAAVVLLTILRVNGVGLPGSGRHWIFICTAAAFGNVLPFAFISLGEQYVDSSLAAIMMAAIPLYTVLIAYFITTDEQLTIEKLIGVIVGFVGVVILIGPSALLDLGRQTMGQLIISAGAMCYAVSGVLSRNLRDVPKLQASGAILLVASAMIVPVALIYDTPWTLNPSARSLFSVFVLGVLATALAQFLVLKIIQLRDASFLSLNNYLVPIFGVFWGVVILAEAPSPNVKLAFFIILFGVLIAQGGLGKLIKRTVTHIAKQLT